MRFMFRLTENSLCDLSINIASKLDQLKNMVKKLSNIAYRLTICYEDHEKKKGEECQPHLHGYIEMDGNLKDKQNMDALRYILKQYAAKKTSYSIQYIKPAQDKATMAYVTKYKHYIFDYNSSWDADTLAEWYADAEQQRKELAAEGKVLFKDKLINDYLEDNSMTLVPGIREIKIWVSRKVIDDKKLPVMSKVRSLTMYLIHKCNISHIMDDELEKLL
jgi:hypothetical protein